MSFISELLKESNRQWTGFPPATDAELEKLRHAIDVDFPLLFLDLLRFSNGGEGELALPPLLFCLDSIDEIIEMNQDEFYASKFPEFLFFGGNGGLELIAFDLKKAPFPIVMVDPVSGEDSVIRIASSFDEFIKRLV